MRLSPHVPGGPPTGRARAAWSVLADLAHAVHPSADRPLAWTRPADVRDELEAAVPHLHGLSTLRQAADALQWGGRQLCTEAEPVQPARFSAPDAP